MVNNTQVGGHLHGFVIDLENSLGYSIKFIHDSRVEGREEEYALWAGQKF